MARKLIALAEEAVGSEPSTLVAAQLVGVRMVIDLVEGREATARATMKGLLEQIPLGGGISEQMLRTVIALPYVLAAESRPYLDEADIGPAIVRSRELAAAFVAAREHDDLGPLTTMPWPDPGSIAASLPLPWAVEFALHGVKAGR